MPIWEDLGGCQWQRAFTPQIPMLTALVPASLALALAHRRDKESEFFCFFWVVSQNVIGDRVPT